VRVRSYVSKDELILDLARGHSALHIGWIGFSYLPAAERINLAPLSLHWRLSHGSQTTGVDYTKRVMTDHRSARIFDNFKPPIFAGMGCRTAPLVTIECRRQVDIVAL
jgi:hypothetical protein